MKRKSLHSRILWTAVFAFASPLRAEGAEPAAAAPPAAAASRRTGDVFGEAVRVPDADNKAMALAIEGNRLYVGAGNFLHIYDISEPLHPRKLGEVKGICAARQVAAREGVACVATRETGLFVVDVSDPSKPRIRSRFDSCELATGVDIAGDVCFLGQRQNGVEFIDISDPDHPRHIAMRKTEESQSVRYRDGYLYSGEWGAAKVTVFDVRDMRNIQKVGSADLHGFGDGVWTRGNRLYAATGHHSRHRRVADEHGAGHGLDIFDITDPANPRHVSRADFPPFYERGLDMWTPRTSGNLVFSSQTHNGLFATDISDERNPKVVDDWVCPDTARPERRSLCIGSVAVADGAVYAAVFGGGLYVIPAKGAVREKDERRDPPLHPEYREPYPTDEREWHVWRPPQPGQARAVAVAGDVAYAAFGDAGLYALRILPGGGFRPLGKLPGHDKVFDVAVLGDRLFTAEGADGFGIYDIRNGDVREIGRLLDTGRRLLALYAVPINDRFAIFSDLRGNDFYDISSLSAIRRITWIGGAPGWNKYFADREVGGMLAQNVANSSVKWYDVAGEKPVETVATTANRLSLYNGLCAFRDGLVLATGSGCYKLLHPGEGDAPGGGKWTFSPLPPAFPQETKKDISGIPRSDGRLVAITSRIDRRAALYDFTDAEHPTLVKAWKLSGNPDLAAFHRGRVLIPCGYQGLLMGK